MKLKREIKTWPIEFPFIRNLTGNEDWDELFGTSFALLYELKVETPYDLYVLLCSHGRLFEAARDAFLVAQFEYRLDIRNVEQRKKCLALFGFYPKVLEERNTLYRYLDALDKNLIASFLGEYPEAKYFFSGIKVQLSLFSEKNMDLLKQEEVLKQKAKPLLASKIEYEGEVYSWFQFRNFIGNFESQEERKTLYEILKKEHARVFPELKLIFDQLFEVRTKIAGNVGMNFVDYMFQSEGKSYSPEFCKRVVRKLGETFVPLLDLILAKKKEFLGLENLYVSDKDLPFGEVPVISLSEMFQGLCSFAEALNEDVAEFLYDMMLSQGFHVSYSPHKDIGATCYQMTPRCMIFGNFKEVNDKALTTSVHEFGHAYQYFCQNDLPFYFRGESTDSSETTAYIFQKLKIQLSHLFYSKKDEPVVKLEYFEQFLRTLFWVCRLDTIQHYLYEGGQKPTEEFERISRIFSGTVEVFDQELEKDRYLIQSHLFNAPFYMFEYGVAGILCVLVWKRYQNDSVDFWKHFQAYLSIGNTDDFSATIAKLGFDLENIEEYIEEAAGFLKEYFEQLFEMLEGG